MIDYDQVERIWHNESAASAADYFKTATGYYDGTGTVNDLHDDVDAWDTFEHVKDGVRNYMHPREENP